MQRYARMVQLDFIILAWFVYKSRGSEEEEGRSTDFYWILGFRIPERIEKSRKILE